jgi:hypothetical protein
VACPSSGFLFVVVGLPYIRSSWGFGSIQPDQGSCVLEMALRMRRGN